MKYLRHKIKGTIYNWNQFMAENPNVEEVTEEQAFPELFAPKSAKGRKPKVDLTTEENPEPMLDLNAELNAELTRKTQV